MNGSIILVMGYPATGKSTFAEQYIQQGYYRLNRDELGGTLEDLVRKMDALYTNEKKGNRGIKKRWHQVTIKQPNS